jgi:hypothetical protein
LKQKHRLKVDVVADHADLVARVVVAAADKDAVQQPVHADQAVEEDSLKFRV